MDDKNEKKNKITVKILLSVLCVTLLLALMVIIVLGVKKIFSIALLSEWLESIQIKPADLLSYISTFLAFIGTALVSILALSQNKRFREEKKHEEIRAEKRQDGVWKRSVLAELNKISISRPFTEQNINDKSSPFELSSLKNEYFTDLGFATKIFGQNAEKYSYYVTTMQNLQSDITSYGTLSKEIYSKKIALHQIIRANIEGFDIAELKDEINNDIEVLQSYYQNIIQGFEICYDEERIIGIKELIKWD